MRLTAASAAFGLLVALSLAAAALPSASAGGGTTERVSLASDGTEADGPSEAASVSADGRFVAFASDAANLVANDSFGTRDIFVRDLQAGSTERVSIGTGGAEVNNHSFAPAISGDGRYVAFASFATNLVANDTNGESDIFVYDRTVDTVERASVATDTMQANNESVTPSISANGRYVTFTSLADNLLPGDTNGDRDVFLHDRVSGATELISQATDGTQGNFASGGFGAGPARVSDDGRYVIFGSFANNLVANDTNGFDDVFVRDRVAATTERVSVGDGEEEGNEHSLYGSISDDGRYVAFASAADTLVAGDDLGFADIFLRDRQAGTTLRLSLAPGDSEAAGDSAFAMIAADGGSVAFQSDASNLLAADTNGVRDIFRDDLTNGALSRVSIASDGAEAHGASSFVSTSADGLVAAYQSAAPDLVADDTLDLVDIFARIEPPAPVSPTPTTPGGTPSPSGGTPSLTGTPSGVVLPETGVAVGQSERTAFAPVIVVLIAGVALAGTALALRGRRPS
jgi:Tol biopolymer transport system component